MATCGHIIWDTIRNNKNNLTALHETRAPAWVPETEIRGTFSIILTCLVTLTACVYSAIHLNVPLETGFWHTLTRKIAWVVMALVAPEVVVMTAMLQFYVAWNLLSGLQQLQRDADEDKVDKKFVFDLKYAFFIVMGGVRVHTSTLTMFLTSKEIHYMRLAKVLHSYEIRNIIYQQSGGFRGATDDRPVWQLTPRGLLDLARLGHWLYISPRHINDRSKADGLQKSLVLLQVSWMLASCVARKAYGLPLTLLEIHTMVHVVCAFVMYALWFKKPIDIREPEILECYEERKDAMAYLCHRSIWLWDVLQISPPQSEVERGIHAPACECGEVRRVWLKGKQNTVCDADKDHVQHQRWHAAFRAAHAMNPTTNQLPSYKGPKAFRTRDGVFDTFASATDVPEPEVETLPAMLLIICIIPILYGGIHLTAWASEFPSDVERLLWRGSSISIMSTLLVLPWYKAIFKFRGDGYPDWFRYNHFFRDHYWLRSGIKWAVTVPVILVLWLAASAVLIASILGRFYLVIEAFISLRAVPVGVYWVPSWLKYIPHV